MDPFERHIRERGAVEDAVRAGRAVREVERRSRRVSMKPRTPQRPAGSDLAWIRNNSGMAKMGGQLNNSQADRSGNVAKAKAAGTFDRTRETYNTANAAKGYFMNPDGTIAEPGTAPKAPAPPEKPKGPPAAPPPPAPPQAKTPATPAPATPVAKTAPKTTPQMQEFFKSHAKQSGRENQYFDDKGNPKGKAPAEAPKVANPTAPASSPDPSQQWLKTDQLLAQASMAKKAVQDTAAKYAEKNKPVAKAPEPERVKVDPNMVLKSPGEAEGRATPIETDAQKRAKLAQAAAQEADAKRPGYQKMRQAGGDAIVEVAGAANKAIPKAASAVAEGINTAGKKLTGGLASIGESIRPFFVGDNTEGPNQKKLRELDKSQAARAKGPSFTPLPEGTTPGGYKNATPTQIVKPVEQPKKKLVAAN